MLFSYAACVSGLVAASMASPLLPRALPKASTAKTSITQLFQNNLNSTDDVNHIGALLLDPMQYTDGVLACSQLSETPLTKAAIQAHKSDFINQLNYLAFTGRSPTDASYYIDNQILQYNQGAKNFAFVALGTQEGQALPVLCTQSAMANENYNAVASPSNELVVNAGGNSYTGFRNQKSFTFRGVRFADQPKRFTYSSLTNATGQVYNATQYAPQCPQLGGGSEDCLFLNIQTPYLPKSGSKQNLRPVHFWIYGGGFTSGASNSADGGNFASRDDMVVVTVAYRLGTYGFLAIPGTDIKGNFGIGDQITGLEWVIKNIAAFGGDPNMITINGGSAGAGSVRALLGSPPAIGKYQQAIAMSSLGGGVDLGLSGNYGTTYASYYTINQSYAIAGQNIFREAGCTNASLSAQIQCLTTTTVDLTALPAVARYVVQDGTIVNTPELELRSKNPNTAHIPVMFGTTKSEGAAFVGYNKTCTTELSCLMSNIGISQSAAQSIINSGLFPWPNTGNVTADAFNVSQRITTDNTFKCADQATVYAGAVSGAFAKAYYWQSNRTEGGYNPNNVDDNGPVVPGYPNGDPELPYYSVHGADMNFVWENPITLRDAKDLPDQQLQSGMISAFIRSGDPNPGEGYLMARGYTSTLDLTRKSGPWSPVENDQGPIKVFDYLAYTEPFQELAQCAFLGYPISYYISGGV